MIVESAERVSHFRVWCTSKWFEHVDEINDWTGRDPDYAADQYFAKYKWWLKREFKATEGKYE